MLPFAHFMIGSLFSYAHKGRDTFTLLTCGFLGIMPDFDFIICKLFGWHELHRGISHSIIFWAIGGLITLWLFRNFIIGFLSTASHWLLDVIDGGAQILPYINIKLPTSTQHTLYHLFGATLPMTETIWKNAQLWMSTFTGCAALTIILIIEHKKWKKTAHSNTS